MCQGNGASPACWAVISICILSAHQKKGHGAKFICPVTKLKRHLSTILYVDDTDILHIDLKKDEKVEEVHDQIQASVNSWGNLLIATGGALQPAKCLNSIISSHLNGGTVRGDTHQTNQSQSWESACLCQGEVQQGLDTNRYSTPRRHWVQ